MNVTGRFLSLFALSTSYLLSACETGMSRQMSIKVDSPKLAVKDITLPAVVKMTEVGHFNGVIDVSWLSTNFERLARKSLPPEGGSGGDRYHFSNFSLTANPDGTLRGFVHIHLDNYKYTKKPWGGQWDWRAGQVDGDVIATITPSFKDGHPTTITSTKIIKTNEKGFVKIWNNALPKIWFSLDRKFQTANNSANKKDKPEVPVLKVKDNPDLDPFIDDILKRGLVTGKSIQFKQQDKNLLLVLDYQVVGGLAAYWEVFQSYRRNAHATNPQAIAVPTVSPVPKKKPKRF